MGPIQAIDHQSAISGFSKANVWSDRGCLKSILTPPLPSKILPCWLDPPQVFLPINKGKNIFLKEIPFSMVNEKNLQIHTWGLLRLLFWIKMFSLQQKE